MRYRCDACLATFFLEEADESASHLRCPKCLRKKSVSRIEGKVEEQGDWQGSGGESESNTRGNSRFGLLRRVPSVKVLLIFAAVSASIAASGAAIFFLSGGQTTRKAGTNAASPPAQSGYYRTHDALFKRLGELNIAPEERADLFVPGASIRKLVGEAEINLSTATPIVRLRALSEVVAARLRDGRILRTTEPFSGGEPPRAAESAAKAISLGERPSLSSFELALLVTSMARAADVRAIVAEASAPIVLRDAGLNGRAPALEQWGTRGFFASALEPEQQGAQLLAVCPGAEIPADLDPLSDEVVFALFLAQRGLARLPTEPKRAAIDADLAARVGATSPTLSSARAAIAEIADLPEVAVSLWGAAAANGGNDAPRLAALALAHLVNGDDAQALLVAKNALILDEKQPTAHAALAWALASRGESIAAKRELVLVEPHSARARGIELARAAVALADGQKQSGRELLDAAIASGDLRAQAALMRYELALSDGDSAALPRIRERAKQFVPLAERLLFRFDALDASYSVGASAPPQSSQSASDGGGPRDGGVKPDGGKRHMLVPDGRGTPIRFEINR